MDAGLGVEREPDGDWEVDRGGVAVKGGLEPGWNGCSSRCIGLGLLGDRGGEPTVAFPASSRRRLEKSMLWGGSKGTEFSLITLSKALGWCVAKARSSGLRWCRGGGLNKGGVLG